MIVGNGKKKAETDGKEAKDELKKVAKKPKKECSSSLRNGYTKERWKRSKNR